MALADPSNDRKNFAALRKLKQRQPALKTLISIGGWDYSTYFSDVASSAARREAFAQSCLEFILEHGFDGIDLDWEYPVSGGLAGNTNRPQDKQISPCCSKRFGKSSTARAPRTVGSII